MFKHLLFNFPSSSSPTIINLSHYLLIKGWRFTRFPWRAHFNGENLNFDKNISECLEFKHRLAHLTAHYCSQVMPLTYGINDGNWPLILTEITQHPACVWILKPALLNNGQGIKIFSTISEIEEHFLKTNRLGGEHILQQYILHPHLLNGKRKYSIRQFVILTHTYDAYVYHEGYFNIALKPYSPSNFENLQAHLTNEHLFEEKKNTLQIPSTHFSFFPDIQTQTQRILIEISNALKLEYPVVNQEKCPKIAFLGVDFMVDESGRVWLLEINDGPCFPINSSHPLHTHLYHKFWPAVIDCFIKPIASKQSPSIDFNLFSLLI